MTAHGEFGAFNLGAYDAPCDDPQCPACTSWDESPDLAGPTFEEQCESESHRYHGDDGDRGRCYCGKQTFPLGGSDSGGDRDA